MSGVLSGREHSLASDPATAWLAKFRCSSGASRDAHLRRCPQLSKFSLHKFFRLLQSHSLFVCQRRQFCLNRKQTL